MSIANFLYRQKQKLRYHTAKNDFDRSVAEINRHRRVINVVDKSFNVIGFSSWFDINKHAFLIEKFSVIQRMLYYRKGEFSVGGNSVFFNIDHLKLRLETAEEVFIVHEIFFENCYNFIVPNQNAIVVDIGMNVGFASLFFANKSSVAKVYGFEPFFQTYEAAQVNFSYNPLLAEKIVSYNYGLSNISREVKVPYCKMKRGRNKSALPDSETDSINITNVTLKDAQEVIKIIAEENKGKNIFIKMDCEGAEYEIFDSLSKTLLPQAIKGIMMEWHFKEPNDIVQILRINDFKMVLTNLGTDSGLLYAFR